MSGALEHLVLLICFAQRGQHPHVHWLAAKDVPQILEGTCTGGERSGSALYTSMQACVWSVRVWSLAHLHGGGAHSVEPRSCASQAHSKLHRLPKAWAYAAAQSAPLDTHAASRGYRWTRTRAAALRQAEHAHRRLRGAPPAETPRRWCRSRTATSGGQTGAPPCTAPPRP